MGIGGGLGGLFGSVIGDIWGGSNRDEEERLLREMEAGWGRIDPRLQASLEDVVELGPSAYENLNIDAGSRDAQVRAYRALMERGLSGGMDAESRAQLAEAQTAAAQQESGARQALQQRYAAMGRGGGMAAFAAQLANTQASAERGSQAATRAAGDASARAYQAIAQGGSLAGQVRGQDYQQASDKASARDLVAQHNARNRQEVGGRNADRTYRAAYDTLQARFAKQGGLSSAQQQQMAYQRAEQERKLRLGYSIGTGLGEGVEGAYTWGKSNGGKP